MRKFIDLMEGIKSDSLVTHISHLVREGNHEGYHPYWKLTADPRVLEDESAMMHISDLIAGGFTSGMHPNWELKVVEGETGAVTAQGEDVGAVEDRMTARHPELDEEDTIPGDIPYDDPSMVTGRGIQAHLDDEHIAKAALEIDLEDIHADIEPHKVVAVAQTQGEGQGWFEVADEEAELFVVEDEAGEPVEGWVDRVSAETHAHSLNNPTVIDEEDVDPTDTPAPAARNLDKLADYMVIIQCIHERGAKQTAALAELNARGLWLSTEQKAQAGLV